MTKIEDVPAPKIGEVWRCSREHTRYGRVLIVEDDDRYLLNYLSTPRKPKIRNVSKSVDRYGKPVYQASVEIYDFKTHRKSYDDVELEAWLRHTEAVELAKIVYWL